MDTPPLIPLPPSSPSSSTSANSHPLSNPSIQTQPLRARGSSAARKGLGSSNSYANLKLNSTSTSNLNHSSTSLNLPQPTSDRIPSITPSEIDRFATLFSPATPPATPNRSPSPTSTSIFSVPPNTTATGPSRYQSHHRAPSDEFGAFVSVPAAQDPLSISAGVGVASFTQDDEVRLHKRSSLDFFDAFTSHAKKAAQKRGVLDELLEYEADPMRWVREGAQPQLVEESMVDTKDVPPVTSESDMPSDMQSVQCDMPSRDAIKQATATTSPSRPHFPLSPSKPSVRASTSPPPLDSALSASPPTNTNTTTQTNTTTTKTTDTTTNTHTNSLSKRSSSWMTSLLSSRSHPDGHPSPERASLGARGTAVGTTTTTSSSFTPGTTFSAFHHVPHPPSTHAHAHVYIPPSGAPGYAGEESEGIRGRELREELQREAQRKGAESVREGLRDKRSVRLVGRREATCGVLGVRVADLINPHLPLLLTLSRSWVLLYSLDQHGISLNTLYTRCETQLLPPPVRPRAAGSSGIKDKSKSSAGDTLSAAVGAGTKGALVVIRDAGDNVFGAWIGDGVRRSRGAYYGSGESFLWRFQSTEEHLDVYKWTGKNEYVALCENEFISFGGGDGQYGLYLDDTLLEGSSAGCPTFDNEPLCPGRHKGKSVPFECVGLEVWGVTVT